MSRYAIVGRRPGEKFHTPVGRIATDEVDGGVRLSPAQKKYFEDNGYTLLELPDERQSAPAAPQHEIAQAESERQAVDAETARRAAAAEIAKNQAAGVTAQTAGETIAESGVSAADVVAAQGTRRARNGK